MPSEGHNRFCILAGNLYMMNIGTFIKQAKHLIINICIFLSFFLSSSVFTEALCGENWDKELDADIAAQGTSNSFDLDDSLGDDFSTATLSSKQLKIIEEFNQNVHVESTSASDVHDYSKNPDYAVSEKVGENVYTTFHKGGYTKQLSGVKVNVMIENNSNNYLFDVAVRIHFKTKPSFQLYLLAVQAIPGETFEEVRDLGQIPPNQTVSKVFYFDTRVKDKSVSPVPNFKNPDKGFKAKEWSSGKYYTKFREGSLRVEPIIVGYLKK